MDEDEGPFTDGRFGRLQSDVDRFGLVVDIPEGAAASLTSPVFIHDLHVPAWAD